MQREDTLEQARFIFTTGKMIRDRLTRIHACTIPAEGHDEGCYELSMSQMHAVLMTRDRGQVTVSELAEILSVSPPSASAMVDRLVEKGVLTREHSREDRRKVVVRVSPEASKNIDNVEGRILLMFVELVDKIGSETARKWCDVLERVQEVLAGENGGSPPRAVTKR